jgi:hypothetical protein
MTDFEARLTARECHDRAGKQTVCLRDRGRLPYLLVAKGVPWYVQIIPFRIILLSKIRPATWLAGLAHDLHHRDNRHIPIFRYWLR